jgi:hypothetical protein
MPLKRNYLTFALAMATVVTTGCADRQLPQTITGSLSTRDGSGANRSVRLYESYEKCEGNYVEARTNEAGEFKFQTTTWQGGISEVTQSVALCVERDGKWLPLWSTITGGGAEAITLVCKPAQSADDEFCEMRMPSSGSAVQHSAGADA